MRRDYTQATKQRLLQQINEIEKEHQGSFLDRITDMFSWIGKTIHIINLADDMSNVKSYQRTILDMTNTTRTQLNAIFEKVYNDDKSYSNKINDLGERQRIYNEKIVAMRGYINPNFQIASASDIKNGMKEYNKQLKELDGRIEKAYSKELNFQAGELAKKGAVNLLKGLVSIVTDVLSAPIRMVKAVATGNPISLLTIVTDLILDVFKVGSGLASVLAIFGMVGSDNYNRGTWLNSLSPYADVKDYKSVFKMAGLPEDWGEKIDMVLAFLGMIDLVSGIKNLKFDFKFGFKTEISKLKPEDIMYKGMFIDPKDWKKFQSLYVKLQKYYSYIPLSNIKKLFDYALALDKGLTEGDWGDLPTEGLKNLNFFKLFEKILSFVDKYA